jgi:hypothetical protein
MTTPMEPGPGSPEGAQAIAEHLADEHQRLHKGETRPPLREDTVHPPRTGRPDPQQAAKPPARRPTGR